MSDIRTQPVTARVGKQESFDDRVDRCLAMVLHHAEVQEIAVVIKKVHADRLAEKNKCEQTQ